MDSYCSHSTNNERFDDEHLLLDDENTSVNNHCRTCNRKKPEFITNGVLTIEDTNWIQNRIGRFHSSGEHLDSPEDSPLLNSDRSTEFGNLSIGDFHCHTNFKYAEDNKALKKLVIVSVLCFLFMITELIGGYVAGSLAVMTDAAHLFSDLIGFLISMISIGIAKKQPTRTMTFGYHRAEVLGAFLSVLAIWVMAGTFFILAVGRLFKSEFDIDSNAMLLVSSLGLILNIIMGAVLHGFCNTHSHGLFSHNPSHEENINVRAATAHVIGDLVQSIGVLFAALIIKFIPSAKIADPICTILFSIIVFVATLRVAKDSFLILLEASSTNVSDLMLALLNLRGVRHVHSVRVWTLSPGKEAAAAHLAVDDYCDRDTVLNQATYLINKRLKVISCHIQVECFDQQLINSCIQCQELQC